MAAERIYHVAYVATDRPEHEIRSLLSVYGAMCVVLLSREQGMLTIPAYSRRIYPWNATDSNQVHFFVEFDHPSSVKRATALTPPMQFYRIQNVSLDNRLAFNFLSIAPPSSPSFNKINRDEHWRKTTQETRNKQSGNSQSSTYTIGSNLLCHINIIQFVYQPAVFIRQLLLIASIIAVLA
jgi:hypothetical protein